MAKAAAHPKYIDMIVSAVKALGDKNGSSRQAINKYIVKEYKLTENNHHLAMLKQALKRGSAEKGSLVHNKGKGAAGSFKLNTAVKPKSKVKSPKKKPAKAKKKVVKKGAKKAPKAKAPTPKPAVPESVAVVKQKPGKSSKASKAKGKVAVKPKTKSASKAASPKKPKAKKSPKKGPAKKSKK